MSVFLLLAIACTHLPATTPTAEPAPSPAPPAEAGDPVFVAWNAAVRTTLKAAWTSPSVPASPTLLHLTLDDQGVITSITMTGSCGDPAYDAAAESAVRTLGSLPAPPPAYAPFMAQTGMDVRMVPNP